MFSLCAFGLLTSPSKFFVEPVVERKVTELPSGPLYWRLENFPTLAQAQGAAGPTSLAAEVAGKVWLFTLAPKEGATHFKTRTLDGVRTEMSLHLLAYNLKRVIAILGPGPLMAAMRA
jgi:hypothetical protein